MPTITPARHRAAHRRARPLTPARARRSAWYLVGALLVLATLGLYLARGSGPAAPAASGNVADQRAPASCGLASGASCAGRPFH